MASRGRGLTLGDRVEYAGQEFVYESGSGNRLGLRNDSGELWFVGWNEVAHFGGLKVLDLVDSTDVGQRSAIGTTLDVTALMETVDKGERKRVARVKKDIDFIESDDPATVPRRKGERTALVASRWGVSTSAVDKWRSRHAQSGIWGLVDHRTTRQYPSTIDPRIREAILEQASVEVDESTGGLKRFTRRVRTRLQDWPDGPVSIPGKQKLERQVAEVLAGTYAFADAKTRSTNAGPDGDGVYASIAATRAGEQVLLDTNDVDVRAWDPASKQAYKLNLTLAIDVATRSILAWRFTPVSHTAIDVVMLLADMMTPHAMRPEWDNDVRYVRLGEFAEEQALTDDRLNAAAAVPVIYPEALVHDRGMPYVSANLRLATSYLGVNLRNARPFSPQDKTQVERLFRTINSQLMNHMAGYRGESTARRGKHVDLDARWTIEEIEDFFAEYVVCYYQRRSHGGLRHPTSPGRALCPNKMYEACVRTYGRLPVPQDPNLRLNLYPMKWCRISNAGVQVNNFRYNAPVLKEFVGRASTYPNMGGKWPIRFHPQNRLKVYFKHPRDGEFHELPWTHHTNRMPPFHAQMLALLRDEQFGAREISTAELEEALEDLQSRTDSPEMATATSSRQLLRIRKGMDAARRDEKSFVVVKAPKPATTDISDTDIAIDLSDLKKYEVD